MHGFANGGYFLILGFLSVIGSMAFWFRDVISEGALFMFIFMIAVLCICDNIEITPQKCYLMCVIPVKVYKNAYTEKVNIFLDNKGKCEIYMWTNLLNNKRYVGSSMNLRIRLGQYFNANFLVKYNMIIYKAILKYGYSSFKLEILEYCGKSDTIQREQYYLDLLKPDYNILSTAGSLLGFKHSELTKAGMRLVKTGLRFSELTRAKMRKSALNRLLRTGKLGHFQGQNHSEESKSKIGSSSLGRKHSTETKEKMSANSPLSMSVIVTNKETNEIKELTSKRQAAKYLNTSLGSVINYEKKW